MIDPKLRMSVEDTPGNYADDEEIKTEEWMAGLGTKFIAVRFWNGSRMAEEKHVDDPITLFETVTEALHRRGAAAATYAYQGRWACIRRGRLASSETSYYDTQDQAEMVAIHAK